MYYTILAMKSTYLLLLATLTCGNLTGSRGQQGAPVTEDGMLDHRTIDDIILQKAETILLRYILEKIGEDGDTNGKRMPVYCTSNSRLTYKYLCYII